MNVVETIGNGENILAIMENLNLTYCFLILDSGAEAV